MDIDPNSMKALEDLRKRNKEAIKRLGTRGRTAVVKMLAFVSGKFAEAWEREAPRLTGSLALSTRAKVNDGRGEAQVFIDPATTNPILGGKPSVYGAIVHEERNPWVSRVFITETPKIMKQGADVIWDALDEIYKQ